MYVKNFSQIHRGTWSTWAYYYLHLQRPLMADEWMDGADPVLAFLCEECSTRFLLRQRNYNLMRNAQIMMFSEIMFDMRKLIGKTWDSRKEF